MWHVNPESKNIGVCRATVKCRFGEANHYENSEKAYESVYEELPSLRKNSEEYRELQASLKPYITADQALSRYAHAQAKLQKKFDYTKSLLKALGVLGPASLSILMPPPVTVTVGAIGAVAVAGMVVSDIREDRKEKAESQELIEAVDAKQARLKALVAEFSAEISMTPQEARNLLHTM